jgi:hypothetical protein
MRRTILILATLIPIVWLCLACSPAIIMINKTPELRGGNPLSEIGPLVFLVNDFVDARMIENPRQVGYGILGFNHKILADRKAKDLVRESIVLELKRNGQTVLESAAKDVADVVLEGSVQELWVGATAMYSGECRAVVKTKITVSRRSSGKSFSKVYSGIQGQEVGFKFMSKADFERLLNDALVSMVKDITMDSEFLEMLR